MRAPDNRSSSDAERQRRARAGYIRGEDRRMVTHHLNQLLLLAVIFSATRTPAQVQGARDFSKKGKVLK